MSNRHLTRGLQLSRQLSFRQAKCTARRKLCVVPEANTYKLNGGPDREEPSSRLYGDLRGAIDANRSAITAKVTAVRDQELSACCKIRGDN
jgi:hypothetical protein